MTPIGLIGFGRVGRRLFRELHARGGLPVVGVAEVNPWGRDPGELARNLAYLLKHDSAAGVFAGEVGVEGASLVVDGRVVPVFFGGRPGEVDWAGLGARVLVEASGNPEAARGARGLVGRGVEKLVITRSEAEADVILVRGVNLDSYDPAAHHVVSCSTCTANALAPLLELLDRAYGIEAGSLTSVHPALSGDTLLDSPACEGVKGRSGLFVRPVTSEMARTVPQLLPGLAGRLTAMSLRVPTLVVNALLADLVLTRPPASAGEVEGVLREAAAGPLAGVLGLEEGFLGQGRSAMDFAGDPRSAVVDLHWLQARGSLLRLLIWHDNEYAYVCRVADTLEVISKSFLPKP
jgi:glyceraldehyde 3-phosphate dehydrogenase